MSCLLADVGRAQTARDAVGGHAVDAALVSLHCQVVSHSSIPRLFEIVFAGPTENASEFAIVPAA
ncbi:MAG: hypothetical protein ABJB97_11105 [Acidobacteriota bacterium]